MRQHLGSKHKKEKKELDALEAAPSPTPSSSSSRGSHQPTLNEFLQKKSERKKNPYSQSDPKYQTLKTDLSRLSACTSFNMSLVGAPEFQMLITNLDSKAGDSLPCRNTLRKWTVAFGERIQRNVVSTLLRIKHFYVIIDIWSSAGMTHFHLGITVAYYNHRTKVFD